MRSTCIAAAALCGGLLGACPVLAAPDNYNPNVQVRYDALGNIVEGPGITPLFGYGAPSTRGYSRVVRELIDMPTRQPRGTVIINTAERRLYLILGDSKALRYGIGVGRPGFTWAGTHRVTRKAEWPGWTPPPAMRKRQPNLPSYMAGGPQNPLGARAIYIGSTFYRIHGSNEPWTIGQAVSSGCFRMTNEDVTDLYERVGVGARVVVVN